MVKRAAWSILVFALAAFAQNPNTPVYPGGIATDSNLLVASNNAISSLPTSLNSTATTIVLLSGSNFIAPTAFTIDSELIFCTTLTSNTYTSCTRGWQGTTPATHNAGALVYENMISYYHNQDASEIKAIEAALGTNFSGGGVSSHGTSYALTPTDNNTVVVFNGSALTATLPNPPPSNKWSVTILNLNSSSLTISPNGLTINTSSANITLTQYASVSLWTDGTNYFSASGGGGGGSSLFTSFQVGSSSALVGSSLYYQMLFPSVLNVTRSGSGTSGSPYQDNIQTATESQNSVAAGPASGGAGVWAFRPLVLTDLPSGIGPTINSAGCALGGTCSPYGGVNVYTSSHTVQTSPVNTTDIGKLIVMNCSSACTLTFEGSPALTDWWGVESIGSTLAAVSLNGKNWNGGASVPVLNSYRDLRVGSDGANYFGDAPLSAGSNITFTPTPNALTLAATGGGSSPLTTKGDLFGFSTLGARVPVGTDGTALLADSTQALGIRWGSVGSSVTWNLSGTPVVTGSGFNIIPGTGVLVPCSNVSGTFTCTPALDTSFAATHSSVQTCIDQCVILTDTAVAGQWVGTLAGLGSYTDGSAYFVKFVGNNSVGSDTLNFNAIGPVAFYYMNGTTPAAVTSGMLRQNQVYSARYSVNGGPSGTAGLLILPDGASTGVAGVSSFSGDGMFLNNSSSTGAVTATLANAAAHKFWGNNTGATAAPGYESIGLSDLPGSGSISINSTPCVLGSSCTVSGGGGGSSITVGPQLVAPPPGLALPVLQQFPGQTQALGGALSGQINGTFNGIYYVTGLAPFQTLATTYNYAVASGATFVHIVDNNLSYANPETMYCTPWVNDGTESVGALIEIGGGILLYNNHLATGAACPASQAVFSASKNMVIQGVGSGYRSDGTNGTIIRAGAMWSTTAVGSVAYVSAGVATYCPTVSTCLMPLAMAGDWTGSGYVEGAQLKDLVIDGNYLPGVLGVEIRSAQESSGLWFTRIRNSVQGIYYHSNLAQNSWIVQAGNEGCFVGSHCLADSVANQVEWDNVPDSHGIVGGTWNNVNTQNWNATGFTQTGTGPYTVTVTVAATQLGTPSAPTITTHGTAGSTAYAYKIVALQTETKPTAASAANASFTTGNATLSTSNYNIVSTSTLSGAYQCKVYRTTGGATQGYIGSVVCGSAFNDIGYVASAQDITPSASNLTGIAAGDWISWSGFTSVPQGVAKVLASPAPTSTTFAFTSAVTFGTTSTGNIAIVPQTEINACVGTSCVDGGPSEPMIAMLNFAHLEHAGYAFAADPNTVINIAIQYEGLTSSVGSNNTDLWEMVHVPAVAIKALTGGAIHGTATNSLYDDLNQGFALPSSAHADSGESYGINGTSIPYSTTLGVIPSGVSPAFLATPTFTCPSSTNGVVTTFTLGQLTGNVTSSTLASCTAKQLIVFVFQQAASGGPYTVAMPTGFDPAPLSQTANIYTTLVYEWDGTNGRLLNSTNDTQTTIYMTERSVSSLVTPSSGTAVCAPDSTDHAGMECKANASANVFKMLLGTGDVNPLTNVVTQVEGAAIPASANGVATNSSKQLIAQTAHNIAAPLVCADSSGSPTAQSCTTSPSFTPATGDTLIYTTTTANTGALTIAVNGGSAAGVDKWAGSTALASGDIPANKPIKMTFDAAGHWDVDDIGNAPSGSGNVNNSGTPASGQVAQWISTTGLKGIDFPQVLDIPSANCNNATGGTGWSLPSSSAPTVACRAGTNNLGGVLQFADAANAQFDIEIPGDADLTTGNYPYIKLFFTDGANTSGTEIFQAQVSCYVSDFSATDDVAFAAAQVFTTRTATAANRSGSENLQFNSTSMSGCVAGASMIVKITRNTDTAASVVNVSKATITIPRLLTQQAN